MGNKDAQKEHNEKPKRFKVDEEEYKEILRLRAIKKEDKQRNRLETIKMGERRIRYAEREIEHRQDQIEKGESHKKHENYIDGKKPNFILINDIEETKVQIAQLKEVNKYAQKEYDKEK